MLCSDVMFHSVFYVRHVIIFGKNYSRFKQFSECYLNSLLLFSEVCSHIMFLRYVLMLCSYFIFLYSVLILYSYVIFVCYNNNNTNPNFSLTIANN